MKKAASTVASLLFTFAILYLPLSFSAWSFNPENWNHLERFIFSFSFLMGVLFPILKKFLPPAVLKV